MTDPTQQLSVNWKLDHKDYYSEEQKALSVLPCTYRGVHLLYPTSVIILMCTKMSWAEQLESSSDRVFGSLSHRCCSQRQLPLSIKQLITQVYHPKEEMKQHTHTQTCTNTFQGKDTHTHRGLSVRSNLLLTSGVWVLNASSWQTKDPAEENNNHTATEEGAW